MSTKIHTQTKIVTVLEGKKKGNRNYAAGVCSKYIE